jgi:hypothetical protein
MSIETGFDIPLVAARSPLSIMILKTTADKAFCAGVE